MPNAEEVWADIPGFEGAYSVSTLGHVKSLHRKVRNGNGYRTVRERILRPGNQNNYLAVILSQENKPRMFEIGELVLTAFTGPRPPGMECRRVNQDKRDNRRENLYWGRPDRRGIKMTGRKRKLRRFSTTYYRHRKRPAEFRLTVSTKENECPV
jgi:NUMOD4 motif